MSDTPFFFSSDKSFFQGRLVLVRGVGVGERKRETKKKIFFLSLLLSLCLVLLRLLLCSLLLLIALHGCLVFCLHSLLHIFFVELPLDTPE